MCGTPGPEEGGPNVHLCTPSVGYAFQKIERLEGRIENLERQVRKLLGIETAMTDPKDVLPEEGTTKLKYTSEQPGKKEKGADQ